MSDKGLLKPTYEELESMYFAQCACTDEWAAKAREKSDGTLLQKIADLQALLDRANATITERNVTEQALRTQLADATRKLEEARKDAERYRWLRGNGAVISRGPKIPVQYCRYGIGLDEAIDQAIEQGKGGDDDAF
jgi:hypothetical protein